MNSQNLARKHAARKLNVWFIIQDYIRDAVVGKANPATPGDEMDVTPAKIQIPDNTVVSYSLYETTV